MHQFRNLLWTVGFNVVLEFSCACVPGSTLCRDFDVKSPCNVKPPCVSPCLAAEGDKLEVIKCLCVRSSLIHPQGQLQPWTDRQLRSVYMF